MSDAKLRELERRAATGDRDAQVRLSREQLRAGARDPRRWPRPGDVVRVARHGANIERWDERRVATCEEARLWEHGMSLRFCGCVIEEPGFLTFSKKDYRELHWERTEDSYESLRDYGLARERRGTMGNLSSWRSYAKNAEVVIISTIELES